MDLEEDRAGARFPLLALYGENMPSRASSFLPDRHFMAIQVCLYQFPKLRIFISFDYVSICMIPLSLAELALLPFGESGQPPLPLAGCAALHVRGPVFHDYGKGRPRGLLEVPQRWHGVHCMNYWERVRW